MIGFAKVDLVEGGLLGDHHHPACEGNAGGDIEDKAAFGG